MILAKRTKVGFTVIQTVFTDNEICITTTSISKSNTTPHYTSLEFSNIKDRDKKHKTFYDKLIRDGYRDIKFHNLSYERLNTEIPFCFKNENGFVIPEKCKPYRDNVLQYPAFYQKKINGFRGEMSLLHGSTDLFDLDGFSVICKNKTDCKNT